MVGRIGSGLSSKGFACGTALLLGIACSMMVSCGQQEESAGDREQPSTVASSKEPFTRSDTPEALPGKRSLPSAESSARRAPGATTRPPEDFSSIEDVDPGSVVERVLIALDDPDPDVRVEALADLEEIDDPAINEALLIALFDDNPEVREAAMEVMEYLESANTLVSLEQAVAHGDINMMESALSVLEEIPDPEAVDLIVAYGLSSEDERIREDAFDALEYITDQEFDDVLDARDWWDRNRDRFPFDE
jgi:HEAT repeat protein